MSRLTELLQRATNGDCAAKDDLLRELYPGVERRVHAALEHDFRPKNRWILPLFSTGDIVQDVFVGVIAGLEGFADKDDGELEAWITTLVKNRIIDRLRFHGAQRRDAQMEAKPRDLAGRTVLPAAKDATPSLIASLDERARLFEQAIGELSAREQDLWRLRFGDERSFDDVAAQLGYANGESARAAFRALRAKLIVRLRRLGIEAP